MRKIRLEILQVGVLALAFAAGAPQAFSQEAAVSHPDAAPQAPAVEGSNPIREEVGKEVVVREESEIQADALVRDAAKAYQNSRYKESVDKYLEAIQRLKASSSTSPYIQDKVSDCKVAISKVYFAWAQDIAMQAEKSASAGDIDSAIVYCTEAMKLYPPYKERMENAIKKYSSLKSTIEYRNSVSEATTDPKKEARLYSIDVLAKQGEVLYKDKQYDQAREKFEEVLSRDPYNANAIDYTRRINLKLLEVGNKRTEVTRAERLAESQWKTVTPLIPRVATGGKSEKLNENIIKDDVDSAINRKLKEIIIDHIEFEDVTIPTVVKYLKQRSKDRDPEKVGVNIFLRLSNGVPGEGAVAEGEAPAEGGAAAASNATVTMVVDDIPLGEAIRYICRAANLKSRVEKYAVVIASQDVPLDEVETRIYPLEKEALDIIGGGEKEAVKTYFEKRGIGFPVGAKIVYDDRISRLIVTNTPDNLIKIEDIIREMNVVDPQVLIQAKFVEVTLNDLEELGFDYVVAKNWNNAITRDGVSTAANPARSNSAVTMQPNPTSIGDGAIGRQASVNVRNAYNNPTAYGLTSTRPDEMFGYNKRAGSYFYSVDVHAVDQADSADVLSTPRVTTMNGQEAVIRMITDYYYPTSWNDAQVAVSGDNSIFTSSTPTFGDPTDEGIILRVTPNVDADHYTITLQMNPVVQQRTGWTDYSYSITMGVDPYTNTLIMPEIEARTVETTVSCYDGETIVLGGILKDTTTTVDDGYPILCDLPLVGRMFQTKGKNSTKTNLLMFLTCRLVNPDGSPIREREMRGLPPFRQ